MALNDPLRGALSLNTATVRKQWELPRIIEGAARFEIPAICPWRDQVAQTGLKKTRTLIRDAKLELSGYCRGGMFPGRDKKEYEENLEDNRRAVEEAAELGAEVLVMVVGGLPDTSKNLGDARKQVFEGLQQLLPFAESRGVRIAVEPLHPMYAADRSCINTLEQALDICDRLGELAGVALDVYHLWWDPKLESQIQRAKDRIFAFHICDWLLDTRDILLDRGMMYDGVIELDKITQTVFALGYNGYCEVEIFSKGDWWEKDPELVLKTCVERHRRLRKEAGI